MKSKAVIFVQERRVEVGAVDLPEPTPRDIVVKTELSGISVGTERWAYLGKRREISFPNVPGYMAVGTIESAGAEAAAKGWQEGQRVYFFATRFAGEMEGKSWMGSHVSQAVIDVCGPRSNGDLGIHHCEKVPEGATPEQAILTGLCGVAMRGIEMATIPSGADVLICGMGVIGQFAAQVCRLKGARTTATDIVPARLETARHLGAEQTINGKTESLAERAAQIAPDGFDVIIDTSSSVPLVNSLFPLLKMRGKFVFQAWYPPPSALDLNALHVRLPTAYFPCAHSAIDVATALRWSAAGLLQCGPLITHTFAPDEAVQAYEMIAEGSENFLGIVFDWRAQS